MGSYHLHTTRTPTYVDSSNAMEQLILQPAYGLYTNNASAPLHAEAGMRQTYDWGLYSYCAYVADGKGICSNETAGQRFTPYDTIAADMFSNYSITSFSFVPENTFRDSKYLGDSAKASYWMILLGTICAALALLT